MLNAFDLDTPSLAHELFPEFMTKKPLQNVSSAETYKPSGHSSLEIRAWLQKLISQENVTATEWARISGLAPSTLNRFINAVDSSANLSARTIDNLAIGMRRIISNRDSARPVERDFYLLGSRHMLTVDVPVIGSVSPYGEAQKKGSDQYRGRNFQIPVMYDVSLLPIAAFVAHSSFWGVYPSGSVLYATPVFGWKHYPIKNARYIFHSKIDDSNYRANVYRLAQDPQGSYWLMPVGEQNSKNPGLFIGNRFKNEKIEIGGKATFLVIGSIMPDASLQNHFDEMAEAAQHAREEAAREEQGAEGDTDEAGSEE